jgi:pyrroline-5-carboxylate reductase
MNPLDLLLPPTRSLGVIGAGVMGKAIVKGAIDAGLLSRSQVWATARTSASCQETQRSLSIRAKVAYQEFTRDAAIVLICVKPKQIGSVLASLRSTNLPTDAVLVSILAGVTTERLETLWNGPQVWLRAMPNTPSLIGQGMTVICGGREANAAHLEQARRLFASVGDCRVVDEAYFNGVTALSGSGPAYMYLIMEAIADAGVRVGLPRELALHLAAQTMLGSARMVLETGRHPASLRDDVTTPAGCTIGGLLMLEDGKIRSVLARAIEEATRIAGQLGLPPR